MKVDEGAIVGGFDRSYDAELFEEETPLQRTIAASSGLDRADHIWVEATKFGGQSWSRRFIGRYSRQFPDCLFTTPHPDVLGVRVQSTVYFVDVTRPDHAAEFELVPVSCGAADFERGLLYLAGDYEIAAFDGVRVLWKTRPVSFEGIRDLVYADGKIQGIANGLGVDTIPFTIDVESGEIVGGYEGLRGRRLDD